ncbi:MAG: hypothetical protein U0869_15785 [Chloroflexota bacterium]
MRGRAVLASGAALLFSMLATSPIGAPGAAGASPSSAPVSDAAAIIQRALDGLGEVGSYRYDVRTTVDRTPPRVVEDSGTVIHGTPFREVSRTGPPGETAAASIVVGPSWWLQWYGGQWQAVPESDGAAPTAEDPSSLGRALPPLPVQSPTMTLVGPETRAGVPVIHYRGETTDPTPSPTEDYAHDGNFGTAFDLWVDAATGRLVAAELVTRERDYIATKPPLVSYAVHESVAITGVDDPANVVEPPSTDPVEPPRIAGADPVLAPVVLHAFAALADLDSWRATIQDSTFDAGLSKTLTVVNRPVPSADWAMLVAGEPFSGGRIVGDDVWSLGSGGQVWEPAQDGEGPHCDGGPCTFASATAIDGGIAAIADTFAPIDDDPLAGVPARHLRSTSGIDLPAIGRIPGTTDLWIATDGGHLLQRVFDGAGISSSVTITGIDDPANVIAPPG